MIEQCSNLRLSVEQFETYGRVRAMARAGDIMLSQTRGSLYDGMRRVFGVQYDHISVFVDGESILHISWPRVRVVHCLQLIARSSACKLVRPQLQGNELNAFLNILSSSIDAKYDFLSLIRAMSKRMQMQFNSTVMEYNPPWVANGDLKIQRTQVCTDLVFYALSVSSPIFRNLLRDKIKFLQYHWIGSFSTDDLDVLVRKTEFFTEVLTHSQSYQPNLFVSSFTGSFTGMGSRLKSWIKLQDPHSFTSLFQHYEHMITVYNIVSLLVLPTFEKVRDVVVAQYPQNREALELIYHAYSAMSLYEKPRNLKNMRKIIFHFIRIIILLNQHKPSVYQTLWNRWKAKL